MRREVKQRPLGTTIEYHGGQVIVVESYQVVQRRIQNVLRDSSERGTLGSLVEFHRPVPYDHAVQGFGTSRKYDYEANGPVFSVSATEVTAVYPRMIG